MGVVVVVVAVVVGSDGTYGMEVELAARVA